MFTERQAALRTRIAETAPGLPTPVQLAAAFTELAAELTPEPALKEQFIDSRGIYAVFGPSEGETIIQGFETAAEGSPVLTRALGWLNQPSTDQQRNGVNLGDPSTRGMIDQLTGTVFTEAQAATLKALGEQAVPAWPGLTLAELQELYRAEELTLYQSEQALIAGRAAEILAAAEAEWQADPEYWAVYQATPNARSQARRDALELADAELREEGAIRG